MIGSDFESSAVPGGGGGAGALEGWGRAGCGQVRAGARKTSQTAAFLLG